MALIPDDGLVWPKRVILEEKLTNKVALKSVTSIVRECKI
jgi:hypothetical protein